MPGPFRVLSIGSSLAKLWPGGTADKESQTHPAALARILLSFLLLFLPFLGLGSQTPPAPDPGVTLVPWLGVCQLPGGDLRSQPIAVAPGANICHHPNPDRLLLWKKLL